MTATTPAGAVTPARGATGGGAATPAMGGTVGGAVGLGAFGGAAPPGAAARLGRATTPGAAAGPGAAAALSTAAAPATLVGVGPEPAAVVDVWLIRADRSAADTERLAGLLDAEERARAATAVGAVQRARFTVAHAAARAITAAALGVPPAGIRWERGPHGRPHPAGHAHRLSVNLSTAGPWAVFATTAPGRAAAQVGVDLEQLPSAPAALRLARRWFTASEAEAVARAADPAERFARLWTCKEAYVKAFGTRLAAGLQVPVGDGAPTGDAPTGDRARTGDCAPTGAGVMAGPAGTVVLVGLPAPPGFRAAVALVGSAPFTVRPRHWNPDHSPAQEVSP